MVQIPVHEIDRIFRLRIAIFLVFVSPRSPTRDEPYAEKGQRAAANKLPCVFSGSAFEVSIQDGRPEDDGQREEDELDWDDLRCVEPLQRTIDVLDLHNGGANQDCYEEVSYRKSDGPPERVRQHRRNAFGR